jgi:AraC-like ligand binding domain
MARWAARTISEVPNVTDGDADDPDWHPLQHFFGLTAFGANVFVARREGQTLVEEHDERRSGQEELYLVLDGEADFELDGERVHAARGTVVAVPDPSVRRSAVARSAGTTLFAVGSRPGAFATTWRESHFADLPRADEPG